MGVSKKFEIALLLVTALLVVSTAAVKDSRFAQAKPSDVKSTPLQVPNGNASVPVSSAVPEIGSKNILVLLPIAHPSHHNVFSALTNALLERGHHVTIVSSRPQKTKHPHSREILINDPFEEFFKTLNPAWAKTLRNPFQKILMMYDVSAFLNKGIFESTEAMALKNEKFDLVVTETYFFQEPLLGFAHHFGCPSMTLNPFGYSTQLNEFTGGSINPSYVANVYGGGTKPETFSERFFNTILAAFSMVTYHLIYYPKANAMLHKVFRDAPPLYDLMNNVTLTLINNHMALMHPVPLSPSVIEVGGMHIKPGKPLTADLKKWIDESEHGIVYFSLGSNLKIHMMSPKKRDALLASFRKLKQRVLLKWNGEIPEDAPENCRFEEWVPQQEVLVHPKLKVFITHGGLLSTQESVYYGAPIIGMPVFGDQAMNVQMAVDKGFAQMVSFHDFTTEELDAALNEVISNTKYREQSQKLSVRFRSDPMTPLERGVYYTELLMKLGDLKHLVPSSLHLHWYQYLLLDVITVIVVGLYFTWRILCCLCCTIILSCCKSKVKKD